MVEAQQRTGRVVQVGLNRRGSSVYRYAVPRVREGWIGKVTTLSCRRGSDSRLLEVKIDESLSQCVSLKS